MLRFAGLKTTAASPALPITATMTATFTAFVALPKISPSTAALAATSAVVPFSLTALWAAALTVALLSAVGPAVMRCTSAVAVIAHVAAFAFVAGWWSATGIRTGF